VIGPASPRQRLILATTVAFVLDFALEWLAVRLLPMAAALGALAGAAVRRRRPLLPLSVQESP
jgi:hypothetical protein